MTPLLDSPNQYLFQLQAMSSAEAKRIWRRAIKEHFDCRCVYCDQQFNPEDLTLDHIIPRSKGGSSMTSNLVPSCRNCNRAKSSRNWLEFMRETFGLQPNREQLILNWIN